MIAGIAAHLADLGTCFEDDVRMFPREVTSVERMNNKRLVSDVNDPADSAAGPESGHRPRVIFDRSVVVAVLNFLYSRWKYTKDETCFISFSYYLTFSLLDNDPLLHYIIIKLTCLENCSTPPGKKCF